MKRDDHLSQCASCASQHPLSFLYNVRHRGLYRRLCTACVLNHHLDSFCPICFDVYDDRPPPPPDRLMCLRCPSISHLSCVASSSSSLPPRYQCPLCSNPNFSFFHPDMPNDHGQSPTFGPTPIPINKDLAKQLLAAARIAFASINKSALVARVEAEKRVKEAVLAKKRAKEALDRVTCLISKQKQKEKLDSKSPTGQHKIKPKVYCPVSPQKRIQNQTRADGFRSPINVSGPSRNGVSVPGNDGKIRKVGGEKQSNGLH